MPSRRLDGERKHCVLVERLFSEAAPGHRRLVPVAGAVAGLRAGDRLGSEELGVPL